MGVPSLTVNGLVLDVPQFKTTPNGLPVLKLHLLATTRFQDTNGDWHDGTRFETTATAFKDLAENIRVSIHKGDLVICTGRVETEEWKDQHGRTRTADKYILNDCGPSLKMARRRHEHVVRAEMQAVIDRLQAQLAAQR